jgi:hypothetical protein
LKAKKFLYFEKRSSLLGTYNAGVVAENSKIVGLAPGVSLALEVLSTYS